MPSPIFPKTGDRQFDEVTALTHSVMSALEGVTAERDRLQAENARLREALTRIRDEHWTYTEARDLARAALKETGK